jgi:hypothetical protein
MRRVAAAVALAAACVCITAGRIEDQTAVRPIDISKMPGQQILLSQKTARPVADNVAKVTIRPGQYVLSRWTAADLPTRPMQAPGDQAVAANYGFIGVTREGQEIRFRPIIESSGNLQVSQDGSMFEGRVFVGLQDLNNPAAAYELPAAVALLISGDVDSVAPQQLSMTHTNLPFTEVTIAARDPGEQFELHLVAAGTTERATAIVKVARPRLELVPARRTIQGFGFEGMDVAVRAIGMQRPGGRRVSLTSEPGSFESSQVTLDDLGTGVARLRSVSVGNATVQASSSPLAPASATVRFVWPFATLIASVLGGLVGALINRLQRGRIRSLRALRPILLTGLLSGIVVVALYAVGVNVLPIQPTATAGEALTFALAAVGGYLGLKVTSPKAR